MAKTIEFRVTRGTSSRIFHLGTASPLVFGLEEFLIGDDGKLIAKVRILKHCVKCSRRSIAKTKNKIRARITGKRKLLNNAKRRRLFEHATTNICLM